jgi:hypothetical protein
MGGRAKLSFHPVRINLAPLDFCLRRSAEAPLRSIYATQKLRSMKAKIKVD